MISEGDSPEGDSNKFLYAEEDGSESGHRGAMVALSPDGQQAVLRALTLPSQGLVLVRERDADQYPVFVRYVTEVPQGWRVWS